MKITIVIASILVVIAIIALIFWPKAKKTEVKKTEVNKTEIKTFWDVVRNPDSLPELARPDVEAANTARSLSGSKQGVAKLVYAFIFDAKSSDDAWSEKRVIANLGAEAFPHALEILRDPA